MALIKWLVLSLLALFLVAFGLSNNNPVLIHFFLYDGAVELPIYVFFFGSVALGVCLCGCIYAFSYLGWMRDKHALKNEVKAAHSAAKTSKAERKINDQYNVSDAKDLVVKE